MRYFPLIVLIAAFGQAFAQVKFAEKKVPTANRSQAYDSLTNFLGINYEKYIGQTLLVLPNIHKENQVFNGFIINSSKSKYSKSNIYSTSKKIKSITDGTSFEDLSNRYFVVKSIVKNDGSTFLELFDKANNETIYFDYKWKYEHTFPFIVVGYFEKMKQMYYQKNFFARVSKLNHFDIYGQNTTDINGNLFKSEVGSTWSIIDVIAINNNLSSKIQFKMSGMGKEIFVLKDLIQEYDLVPKEEYEEIETLYSTDILRKVLNHQYDIGWDTYLIRMSKGSPDKINRTTTANNEIEQWVYGGGSYLYFTNGKLTSIQN